MRHGIHFNFDGKWSYDMGVYKANIQGGLFEDAIISDKTILEERVEGRNTPYFYGVDYSPTSMTFSIMFEDNLTTTKKREVLRWLNQDSYKPLYMKDDSERIWNVMVTNDANVIHNGLRSGYIELNFQANHPHTLMPKKSSKVHIIRQNKGSKTIEFENKGDFDCLPEVHITKYGSGDLQIRNLTNDTGIFGFKGLIEGEKLVVDCAHKTIETNEIRHRYGDFTNNYLIMKRGVNILNVTGDCDLQFKAVFQTY